MYSRLRCAKPLTTNGTAQILVRFVAFRAVGKIVKANGLVESGRFLMSRLSESSFAKKHYVLDYSHDSPLYKSCYAKPIQRWIAH